MAQFRCRRSVPKPKLPQRMSLGLVVIVATANEYARQQNIIGSAILSYLPCMSVFDMCKDFHVPMAVWLIASGIHVWHHSMPRE